MAVSAADRQKRLKQEADGNAAFPVTAAEQPYVELAAHYRALWAQRQRDPRVCDVPGCANYLSHHGQLERKDPL